MALSTSVWTSFIIEVYEIDSVDRPASRKGRMIASSTRVGTLKMHLPIVFSSRVDEGERVG